MSAFITLYLIVFQLADLIVIAYYTSLIRALETGKPYEGLLFEVLLKSRFNNDMWPLLLYPSYNAFEPPNEEAAPLYKKRNVWVVLFWVHIALMVVMGIWHMQQDILRFYGDCLNQSNAFRHATISKQGNPIQIASLASTSIPHLLKKAPAEIGETWMGRNGKKNRSGVNGRNSATPKPPFVIMSSNGWDAVASTSNKAVFGKPDRLDGSRWNR
jgi:hypothetical protein